MLTSLRSRRAPKPQVDRYEINEPRFTAFLDQARWLLAEQQRRGTSFQQAAVALVGFDGVLLALLVGNDTLRGVDRYSFPWWAGISAALLFVYSAIIGLTALKPTGIYTSKAADTIEAWSTFITKGGEKQDTYHFAHMLLATDPTADEPPRGPTLLDRIRTAFGKSSPPTQPLLAAKDLATQRGKIALRSTRLLVGGIFVLLIFLFAVPPADAQPTDSPKGRLSETSPPAEQPLGQPCVITME